MAVKTYVAADEACKALGCGPGWIAYVLTDEGMPLVKTRRGDDGAMLVSLPDLLDLDKTPLEITTPLAAARYGCNRQYIGYLVRQGIISSRKPGRDLLVKLSEVVKIREGRNCAVAGEEGEEAGA